MPKKALRILRTPWSRLKAIPEDDPLETVGLPSKGDKTLLEYEAQEKFYRHIIRRYLVFCNAGEADELRRRFAALNIGDLEEPDEPSEPSKAAPTGEKPLGERPSGTEAKLSETKPPDAKSSDAQPSTMKSFDPHPKFIPRKRGSDIPDRAKALSKILLALRKLREGIVATKRADEFAMVVYYFGIRTAVLAQHPESYHPAILHLLRYIGMWHPLGYVIMTEVAYYLVLDLACRQRELNAAYTIRKQFGLTCPRLTFLLRALATQNYRLFQKVKDEVDQLQLRIIEFADDEMRMHALKCFGRTYHSVSLKFLEDTTERKWEQLQQKDGVGWTLEDDRVIIRKITPR